MFLHHCPPRCLYALHIVTVSTGSPIWKGHSGQRLLSRLGQPGCNLTSVFAQLVHVCFFFSSPLSKILVSCFRFYLTTKCSVNTDNGCIKVRAMFMTIDINGKDSLQFPFRVPNIRLGERVLCKRNVMQHSLHKCFLTINQHLWPHCELPRTTVVLMLVPSFRQWPV